jgi:Rrf2 family protein
MLKISKKTDYGLLIIAKLLKEEDYVPLAKLVEHTKLPPRFLARISAILARHGVLKSREGRVGGYKLGKLYYEISVYDFFSIFEKNMFMTSCQKKGYKCSFENICQHHRSVQEKLQNVILADLKKVALSELFS